jgi:HIRAN domain
VGSGTTLAAMQVDVVLEERYWYPDDGGQVWVAGYQLVDADGRFIGRAALAERGLQTAGVAGAAQHHDHVLQGDDVTPGAVLRLRRDPQNPHDPQAIAVDAPAGGQLGWVPREVAAELAPLLDAGAPWSAMLLRELRDSPRDPRTGVTMLLAPAARLELRVR